MDPRDFQLVAAKLALSKTPAEFRSSISRAYYAALHVSAEILNDIGIPVEKGIRCHQSVITCLHNSKDEELAKIGSQLDDVRSDRLKADYHLDDRKIATPEKAKATVSQTSRMIAILDSCKSGNPERKKKLRQSIKEYQNKIQPLQSNRSL
ncbi:MAG: hypothetical protein ABSG75_14765 [Syntrophales bacterium]|jgi:uncharacterized protein (UPF0332 family)